MNQIRKAIQEVLVEYEDDDDVNPTLLWEMIKLEVREQSLKYAAGKKAKLNRKEEELERRINVLQNLIESSHIGEQEKQDASIEQEEKKAELERIIKYKTKGSILRARCRWHNEGEKNTKYFLNLEKRHFNSGVISQLKTGDSSFVSTDKEILNECEHFYKNLYSSHADARHVEDSNFFFRRFNDKNIR